MNSKGRLLVDFNLRFTVTNNGLTDRVTPLIGFDTGSEQTLVVLVLR